MNIPYENLKRLNQIFESEFETAFKSFIESGWYILGKGLKHFENEFANYHGLNYAVGVANGLDALILSLKNNYFEADSEVIVPSNTYIATILSILHCQLNPVLVEPDINTYNIDPLKIEQAITNKTVAIMPVHLYGQCCDMDKILQIAKMYNLVVIEDCAQAHGALYKGRLSGTFGDYGAFSFYPTKNLGGLGDGGAILCNTEIVNSQLERLRNYGSAKKYYNKVVGYNSRLDELQAIFLNIKLKRLNEINSHKRRLADIYLNNLNEQFILPAVHPDFYHVFHIFNIRHSKRDNLRHYLAENGIGTEIHYPIAPHHQKAINELFKGKEFPISEQIHSTTLSLPCSFAHTTDEIYRVVEVINQFN